MGFWSSIGSAISSLFGGGSSSSSGGYSVSYSHQNHNATTTSTVYEPDRVKAEELANKRVKLIADSQSELLELNAKFTGLIIQAEARSFQHSAEIMKNLLSDLNIIAEQRLRLIENGHLEIVQQIEDAYSKIEADVKLDNELFANEKMPKMLENLEKFKEGSSAHKTYEKLMNGQVDIHLEFIKNKLHDLRKRQQQLIDSSVNTKNKIIEDTSKLVSEQMLYLDKQLESRKENLKLESQQQIENSQQKLLA